MNYEYKMQNNLFCRKENLLSFLFLFIGACIPTFSPKLTINFWSNLNMSMTDIYNNCILFGVIVINIYKIIKNSSFKYNIACRMTSYKEFIKSNIIQVIIAISFIYVIHLILCSAGALLFSFGKFNNIEYFSYSIGMNIYVLFFVIRKYILMLLISICIYLIFENKNSIFSAIVVALMILSFVFESDSGESISHFYEMPYIFTAYFQNVEYSSMGLEFLCSTIIVFIISLITKLLYSYKLRKKNDIL